MRTNDKEKEQGSYIVCGQELDKRVGGIFWGKEGTRISTWSKSNSSFREKVTLGINKTKQITTKRLTL